MLLSLQRVHHLNKIFDCRRFAQFRWSSELQLFRFVSPWRIQRTQEIVLWDASTPSSAITNLSPDSQHKKNRIPSGSKRLQVIQKTISQGKSAGQFLRNLLIHKPLGPPKNCGYGFAYFHFWPLSLSVLSYPEWRLHDQGRLSVVHRSRHSRDENLYTRVGPVGPYHKKRRAAGTSTSALACALASKPQLFPPFTDTSTRAVASTFKSSTSARAVACTVKKNKIRCFSCVTFSLIVGVTVGKQRSAPGCAALDLQRSGAPGAPDQNNIATRFGQNDDAWKRLQRNNFGGACHNNTWDPTQCSEKPITQRLGLYIAQQQRAQRETVHTR